MDVIQHQDTEYKYDTTGRIVLCNFNHLHKVTPELFDIWMKAQAPAKAAAVQARSNRRTRTRPRARGTAARARAQVLVEFPNTILWLLRFPDEAERSPRAV